MNITGILSALISMSLSTAFCQAAPIKALIIDGQNNHAIWPKSTIMMRQYLEETGMFTVDIERSDFTWKGQAEAEYLPLANAGDSKDLPKPKTDPNFKPDFSKYDVVINNFGFNAAPWPVETQKALETYMKNGGGFVSIHAADNCFGDWEEYNKMIGLGGWGGRNSKSGPYVYYNKLGEIVRDNSPGKCGAHGPREPFLITQRNFEHPIVKGLPATWMHAHDECYSHLRGPAENLTILATAADTPELQAAGRNEPMLMTINYYEGRTFHSTLGHDTRAFECVGFIETFLRGTEWAATGKVSRTELPHDFPTPTKTSSRPFKLKK